VEPPGINTPQWQAGLRSDDGTSTDSSSARDMERARFSQEAAAEQLDTSPSQASRSQRAQNTGASMQDLKSLARAAGQEALLSEKSYNTAYYAVYDSGRRRAKAEDTGRSVKVQIKPTDVFCSRPGHEGQHRRPSTYIAKQGQHAGVSYGDRGVSSCVMTDREAESGSVKAQARLYARTKSSKLIIQPLSDKSGPKPSRRGGPGDPGAGMGNLNYVTPT
jgi:hypothetical protein